MKVYFLRIIKRLLLFATTAVMLWLLFNQFLRVSVIRALSESHFEYMQCSCSVEKIIDGEKIRISEKITVDYQKLPEELKVKVLRLVETAARNSYLDFNSYVLGVSLAKRGLSVNVHPCFIVFNVDSCDFTWQLAFANTKEARGIALEMKQWMLSQSQGDTTL